MAQNDMLKRYLDAGIAFSAMNRARAEGIIKDLVKRGEVSQSEATDRVQHLLDTSKKNTESLVATVRSEIMRQLGEMGLATKDDIARLEAKIAKVSGAPAKVAAPAKVVAAVAKKAPVAQKAPAAKKAPVVKKAPAAKKAAS